MQYLIISLIAGSCLLALLLIVFFTAGKKNKKHREADLQLVQGFQDESLLRLYEQAESENERDGIVEFIKEKLSSREQDLAAPSVDLAPAGNIAALARQQDEAAEKPAEAAEAETAPRRVVQGINSAIDISNIQVNSEQTVISGNTAYGEPGETHMLALESIDWQAIEQELQERREEEARIMAQNQQIQEVFSKIRDVEQRLAEESPTEDKQ